LLAGITGALRAKLGERGISRQARDERRRKIKAFFSPPLVSREMPRSPRLAHKAPVMQDNVLFSERFYFDLEMISHETKPPHRQTTKTITI